MSDERPAPEREARKRRTALQWLGLALVVLVCLALGIALFGRFGVLSPAGRGLVSSFVNGKQFGRYGRINVYGLHGDLWDDFTLDRVTVTDAKGVWLDARKVRVDWSYLALVRRRFHADLITAQQVQLIRRPQLEPQIEPPGPMPLAIDIDRFETRIELLEGFSKEYGRWAAAGDIELERAGGKQGRLEAKSLTRPGDFLRTNFAIGGTLPLLIEAKAYEAQGGPLAGALGYSPDRPFTVDVRADGRTRDGRFHALVKTGDFIPLTADGRWTPDGGLGSGRIDFSGSDLLKPFVDRIGAQGRFGVAARKSTGGRFGVGWVFYSDNLSVTAKGRVDPKTQGSKDGVRVEATTPSVARLLQQKLDGSGRFTGVWTGDPYHWRFAGDLDLKGARWDGYALQRVAGPVVARWNNGRADLDVRLNGAGGAGQGVVAGLLGARPEASLAGTRLDDGRVLIQRFDATGAGLQVRAKGSRDLFGGLNFRGDASLTDLRRLYKGASGGLGGRFRATQRGAKPWSISLDARGRRLATGLGELDRLLGPEPRLQADGRLGDRRVELERTILTGAAARFDGKGTLGFNGALQLALGWNARGPFRAGPVEITGAAKGNGSLTGTLAAPHMDLKAFFDRIDFSPLSLTRTTVALTFAKDRRGFDGRVALDAAGGNYGPAHGVSVFRFTPDGLRLDELDLNAGGVQAKGSVALRGRAPSGADLTFAAGPGAFLATGSARGRVLLSEGTDAALATIDVTGENLRPRGSDYLLKTLRLKGSGTSTRLPFTLAAELGGPNPATFAGDGIYARAGATQSVALTGGGRIREIAFRTLQPLTVTMAPDSRALRADLGVSGGRLVADVRQTPKAFDANARLTAVELAALDKDFTGRVDAAVNLQGRGERLTGSLDARLEEARTRGASRDLAVNGAVKAALAGDRLRLTADVGAPGGMRAVTSLDLPVVATAAPLRLAVVRNRPMNGRFSVQGEIRPIWDLLLGGDRSLAGQVAAQGTLAGTINEPMVVGSASVREGRFADADTGLTMRDLTLDARFDRNLATFSQFSARDSGGGQITGGGRVDLRSGGASSFTLELRRFQMIDNDRGKAQASGPITVTRAADGKLKLVGKLRIDRADIAPTPPAPSGVVRMDVVEINVPAGRPAFETPRPRGPGVALDVTLTAPDKVFLRGRGLDVELSLDAHVGGTSNEPELTGDARVVRGDYDFAGRRFKFDETSHVTLSTHLDRIRLDLRATRDDPALTAAVLIRGTAAKPEITLTSTPSLPQDEILAQILFGRSASQLSGVEAAQLASGVAAMAGGGGLDVLGNLREFAGLDRLTFGGNEQSGMTVSGGKYISENVYLELIGGARTGPAVQVEWRAKRQVSIVSQINGQGEARLSLRWRKDFR